MCRVFFWKYNYCIISPARHPESSSRPDSASIVQSLSRSDSKLLKWAEEDRAVHTMAACLGAELEVAQDLYKDLQLLYSRQGGTAGD